MQIRIKYLAMGIMAAALTISPASAKGNGKGSDKGGKHAEKGNVPPGQANKHSKKVKPDKGNFDGDLWLPAIKVEEARRFALVHEFGGQKPLPPGVRKNLMRGKPLPPGIAKKRLPRPYLEWLPGRPGYEWRAYGTDLVLVSATSGLVAHVIMDVLR